jgi:hypothetical protein
MGELVAGVFNRTPHLPWSPTEDADKEFWCERLGIYCRLAPEVLYDGARATYHIYQSGVGASARRRLFPVQSHEIIPAESKAAKKIDTEKGNILFPINKSNFDQIRNFLADDFAPSYPWQGTDELSPEEVKKGIISRIKAPRNGLAREIENERSEGYYIDATTFVERLKKRYEAFPWDEVAKFLDYSTPIT